MSRMVVIKMWPSGVLVELQMVCGGQSKRGEGQWMSSS